VADEQPYLVEYRLRHADGGVRGLWEHAAIVAGEDGRARWIDGAELTALTGAGRHPEAQALAHRIRGMAANLGLEQLASTLARVEQLCAAHGADAAAMSEALSRLVAQLPAALLAIRGEAAPAAATIVARTATPLDPAAVRTAAAQDAAARLGPLRLALDDFDFPLAQSALRAVLDTLDAEPTR